jgi:hypothetical protein
MSIEFIGYDIDPAPPPTFFGKTLLNKRQNKPRKTHFLQPPNYLFSFYYFLGRSYIRLDSITFHWRCPSAQLYPEKSGKYPDQSGNSENSVFEIDDKETQPVIQITDFRSSSYRASSILPSTIFVIIVLVFNLTYPNLT